MKTTTPIGLITILLVTSTCTAIAGAPPQHAAGRSTSALVGVWQAEHSFGNAVEGELCTRRTGPRWIATFGGIDVPVEATQGHLSFALPHDRGRFRGTIDETDHLRGHWIQPATANINYPLASRLQFRREDHSWKADVTPSRDRLRLYLRIRRDPTTRWREPCSIPSETWGRGGARFVSQSMGTASSALVTTTLQ